LVTSNTPANSLQLSEEHFRLFLEAVRDYAIYTLNPEGRVTSWNRGAERIKRYSAHEIIGRHFSCFFTEEDRQLGKPQQELQIAAEEGRFEAEAWRVRQDGSQFWANVVLTAIKDEQGNLIGFVKVTRDFTERMRAREELQRTNAELAMQVRQRQAAEQKLAKSERSLRELSLHLLRTQDEERRRIGRELHDSLGQYLAMLKLNLESLRPEGDTRGRALADQLAQSIHLTDECIREARTISYLLYPPMLEEVGLTSAISWYLEGFSKRSNIQTTFQADPNVGRLARDKELALFRVLQESLTNVHRHSGSATADVRLSQQNGRVILEVKDIGKGIPPELLNELGEEWLGSLGVGLRGMHERMRQLQGTLEIRSNQDGTLVRASLPVKATPPVPQVHPS
jgi:PAS domain S-box-containing protein